MTVKPTIIDLGIMATLKELNNPLTSIFLCIDILENASISEAGKEKYHVIMKKNAASITASLQDMYDIISEKYKGTIWEEHGPALQRQLQPQLGLSA